MALLFASWIGDLIAFAMTLVILGVLYVRHKYAHWRNRGIPYAEPSFPFGNFGDSFMQRRSLAEILVDLYNTDYPQQLIGFWSVLQPTLLVCSPELVREVCIKNFANFPDRGIYCNEHRDPLSGNLFSLGGEKWRNLRAKLSPTFTSGKLKAMFQTLVECGEPLRRFVAKAADSESGAGRVVEVRELVAQYTTNSIASAAFGLDIDCIAEPENDFRRFGRQVLAPTTWNNVKNLLTVFFPAAFRWSGMKAVDADVEEFFMSVVRQNLGLRERGEVVRKDFFQLLVQLRNGGVQKDGVWESDKAAGVQEKLLSLNECAAQSFVFFVAGFETSSTTVSYGLYELAKNPECQRRLQAEIDDVLARHNGEISYDSVSEMKYLDWCFDETLRKYPPLPILNRICLNDWHVPDSQLVVEAGTALMIPIHALQMDPKYYPEPERFIPERFDTEHELFSAQRPYLPFGDGPRNCIGMRFGKMQSKVALVCMLQEFQYQLAGQTEKPLVLNPASFLLSPIGGIQLRVTRREK